MAKLITLKRIPLKNNPIVNEDMIQKYIFENPDVLGLGTLEPLQREKRQQAGGRLDLLLTDDNGARYEVEIQLGATDPSHIIRTIEYWDNERKRYPRYDHCAVIVAEEITSRFMNVISLFNGAIPLIALQIAAYQVEGSISLTFTKVLDRVDVVTDEDEQVEVTDRAYWDTRSTPHMMKCLDAVLSGLKELIVNVEPKYNKSYVGITKNGIATNFVYFRPHRNFMAMFIKADDNGEKVDELANDGLEVDWVSREKRYRVRLRNTNEYETHKDTIDQLMKKAADCFSVESN